MTIKEAILKTLEDIKGIATYIDVFKHIVANNYYTFSPEAKTPESTVSALLGDFIRNGDSRVKRVKREGGTFAYYHSKHEDEIGIDKLDQIVQIDKKGVTGYDERDLHKLFSTYLQSLGIYSKTIFHEKSNGKDNNQKWVHPDMVGISFINLKTTQTKSLLRAINQVDSFKISSYELKKEINSDYDLKQAFFQAVSNSSWSNYGYLVALEIGDNLQDEMERLCQSFGIGVIQLSSYPYQSKVLFAARERNLDFKTIDKLCNVNRDFATFIELTESILSATEKYLGHSQAALKNFSDQTFDTDIAILDFCKSKKIPFDIRMFESKELVD